MIDSQKRIAELDGIRGVAILMVLTWHYFGSVPRAMEPGSVISYLTIATRLFWSGVDLFFVLSGYLICGIILDNHRKSDFLKSFFIRRATRILPLYLLLLLFYVLLESLLDSDRYSWLFSSPRPLWSYLAFVQNVVMGQVGHYGSNFLAISWSLAIEEQFYLIAPVSILLMGRRAWVRAIPALILFALTLRLTFPQFASYVNTPFRMDSLLIGGAVAVIVRNEKVYSVLAGNRIGVLTFCLTGIFLLAVLSLRLGLGTIQYTVFGCVYGSLLLTAILYRDSAWTSVLRCGPLRFFGSIAYGLYMYHQAVNGLLHGVISGTPPTLATREGIITTATALAITIILSFASFHLYEARFLKIGQKYSYGKELSVAS